MPLIPYYGIDLLASTAPAVDSCDTVAEIRRPDWREAVELV